MGSPEDVGALSAAVARLLGLPAAEVEGLTRLSGGASRETWSFEAGGRELILRRDPPGRPSPPGGMAHEAAAMRACTRAGLPVPEVLADDDGTVLGTAGLVMTRVDGEALARRILRDDAYASARPRLADQLGTFLAGLHAVDPGEVPGLDTTEPLAQYWAAYESIDDVSPTFEAARRWLETHRPDPPERAVIVHGDLRLGNVLVGPDGLTAVLDWELLHLGDPVEDLAWVCVRAWRFGSPLPVAGVGTVEQLLGAYEAAGGSAVDRDAFRWWLVQKTLQWGIQCMGQAAAHLLGLARSVELAAVGRRVAEQEWDLVELLAPDAAEEAAVAPPPPAATAAGSGGGEGQEPQRPRRLRTPDRTGAGRGRPRVPLRHGHGRHRGPRPLPRPGRRQRPRHRRARAGARPRARRGLRPGPRGAGRGVHRRAGRRHPGRAVRRRRGRRPLPPRRRAVGVPGGHRPRPPDRRQPQAPRRPRPARPDRP